MLEDSTANERLVVKAFKMVRENNVDRLMFGYVSGIVVSGYDEKDVRLFPFTKQFVGISLKTVSGYKWKYY